MSMLIDDERLKEYIEKTINNLHPKRVPRLIAASPVWYRRPNLPIVTKTTVTIPANTQVNIGNEGYILKSHKVLTVSNFVSSYAGKDVYIYACKPSDSSSTEPEFVLSLNSTYPTNYDAGSSRKIGGFHCLCVAVGTISGHTLTGYAAGDILPQSIWDLRFRPGSINPEGMVFVPGINRWVDIYLGSYSNKRLESKYGATIVDGSTSTLSNAGTTWSGATFAEEYGLVGKHLPTYDEFTVFAKGSNECTNISGSSDPGTTGGHKDTANRRMISNYGIEDCCGAMWQWSSTLFESYATAENKTAYWSSTLNDGVNRYLTGYMWNEQSVVEQDATNKFGSCGGFLRRARLGAGWSDGVDCGSRCAYCDDFSSSRASAYGGRGVAEPIKSEF